MKMQAAIAALALLCLAGAANAELQITSFTCDDGGSKRHPEKKFILAVKAAGINKTLDGIATLLIGTDNGDEPAACPTFNVMYPTAGVNSGLSGIFATDVVYVQKDGTAKWRVEVATCENIAVSFSYENKMSKGVAAQECLSSETAKFAAVIGVRFVVGLNIPAAGADLAAISESFKEFLATDAAELQSSNFGGQSRTDAITAVATADCASLVEWASYDAAAASVPIDFDGICIVGSLPASQPLLDSAHTLLRELRGAFVPDANQKGLGRRARTEGGKINKNMIKFLGMIDSDSFGKVSEIHLLDSILDREHVHLLSMGDMEFTYAGNPATFVTDDAGFHLALQPKTIGEYVVWHMFKYQSFSHDDVPGMIGRWYLTESGDDDYSDYSAYQQGTRCITVGYMDSSNTTLGIFETYPIGTGSSTQFDDYADDDTIDAVNNIAAVGGKVSSLCNCTMVSCADYFYNITNSDEFTEYTPLEIATSLFDQITIGYPTDAVQAASKYVGDSSQFKPAGGWGKFRDSYTDPYKGDSYFFEELYDTSDTSM